MDLEIYKRKPHDSVREYVYRILKKNIMYLNFEPGTSISEKEISEKLSVSRTPVREAFILLYQDGLLEIYPQKGTFISLIDLERVEEARFMRETMEIAIIKEACLKFPDEYLIELITNVNKQELYRKKDSRKLFKLDEQFHSLLFEGTNKKNIWLLIQQLSSHMNRVRMLSAIADYNSEEIIKEHNNIVEAIKNKDVQMGEGVVKHHLLRLIFDQEKLKNDFPGFFKN